MEALAEVLSVGPRQLRVRVRDNGGGCGRCDEPGGCRSVQITHAFGRPRTEFNLARPAELAVRSGDLLRISIAEGAALKAALAAYGLGALLMVAGAALANWLASASAASAAAGDGVMLVGAAAGLLLAWWCNRVLLRSRRWRGQFQLQLLAPEALAATVALAACSFSVPRAAPAAAAVAASEGAAETGADPERTRPQ